MDNYLGQLKEEALEFLAKVIALATALGVIGCGSSDNETAPKPEPIARVQVVSVPPRIDVILLNGNLQLALTAFDSSGVTVAAPTSVEWSSSDTSVVRIDQNGLAHSVGRLGVVYIRGLTRDHDVTFADSLHVTVGQLAGQ